jgi:hypothetical protein
MHTFRGELTIYCCQKHNILCLIENSNWLTSNTKKGEIESASRYPSGFGMRDDKQLEAKSFIESWREFSLVESSTFIQKGKKGKRSKAPRMKIL